MQLGLIPFYSDLHDHSALEAAHAELIAGLRGYFNVSFIRPEEAGTVDQAVAFIASGGVEADFSRVYPKLPRPLLLLSDGSHNSFPAAMEILAWIRERGDSSEILHGDVGIMAPRLERLSRIIKARRDLAGSVIGMLGTSSPWLIASHVDPIAAARHWGISFRSIEIEDLTKYRREVENDEAAAIAHKFSSRARAVREPSEVDIVEAARIFMALKRLVSEEQLNAITVRCFDFIKERTTGCLALSLLNDEGLVAGCESDAQSVFSMLLLKLLTGQTSFMANPTQVKRETNKVIFAHCTIATRLTREYIIRSHFESGVGVAIQGEMIPGPVTIFKCGGPGLDRFFISGGRLLENLGDPHSCRTQVELVLDEPVDYFLKTPLSNHHVIIPGNHVELLREFTHEAGNGPLKSSTFNTGTGTDKPGGIA
ncbi:MAG: fucose isomerase [Candidatus Riflebacteria bacterium]|nr:fucose isomerase [Candidatus Riflebacteria bacterium]